MLFYLGFLMVLFDNFSDDMCLYTVMHGSYGLLWYMKHIAFPDKTYMQTCTISCALLCWVSLLGPYMVPGYLLASGQCQEASKSRKYLSLFCYIIGVCLTLCADCQKNFILKYHKQPILIQDGLFSRTRNPNYLGEIFLYGSFATLTNHWLSYAIIAFAYCSIFPARIFQKEVSLKQKSGWTEYAMKSNVLFPKVMGLTDVHYFVAIIFLACFFI